MRLVIVPFVLLCTITNAVEVISTVAGNGISTHSGDGGPATSAGIAANRVATNSNNKIYTSDAYNHRIRKVNAQTGINTTIAGNGVQDYFGDGRLATNASLNGPYGFLVDSVNNYLYIADSFNGRVRRVNLSTGIISTVAGNGTGTYYGHHDCNDGLLAANTSVWYPGSLALDSLNNLYIAEYSTCRIRKVKTDLYNGFEKEKTQ